MTVLFFSVSFACVWKERGGGGGEEPEERKMTGSEKDVSGSWYSRGWKFPNLRFKTCLLIGPEKAAARRGRFM